LTFGGDSGRRRCNFGHGRTQGEAAGFWARIAAIRMTAGQLAGYDSRRRVGLYLLPIWRTRWGNANALINKSFLVLFLKKELLPCFVRGWCGRQEAVLSCKKEPKNF
jgi:hypothetical protein